LALGTANQQLRVNSGATAPEWFTPAASGGMVLISTTTLTGSSINLTSISQTYKDLYVVMRDPRPVQDNVGMGVRVNNDSGTSYRQNQAFATSNLAANATEFFPHEGNADNGASDGLITILIRDYANTSTYKLIETIGITNNNTTLANFNFALKYVVYYSTSAISQLNFFPEGVSGWDSGTVLLYGVS
jgi:hypothetical protein